MFAADVARQGSVVSMARRLCAVDSRSPFHHVKVELENAPLAENKFGNRHECKFRAFAEDGTAGAEEKVFDELLGDRGSPAHAPAFHIVFSVDLYLMPVESMVLVEARILGRDDSVLKIRRNLVEGNELVALVIGRMMKPGLQPALCMDRRCLRVDPPRCDKDEHGERPKQSQAECKQENKQPKQATPIESFDSQGWKLEHDPEY